MIVDKSIELLPDAEVDVARFTIAISNLINNAIKYSYPNTKIFVRSSFSSLAETHQPTVVIEVDDLGDEIQPEDRDFIFKEGDNT